MLEKYCHNEQFRGWDPYDGLNSKVFKATPVLPKNRLSRLMWIQFIKKMPFNLRPALGIEKDINPKGLALFISGYSKLSEIEAFRHDSVQQIKVLASKLISLRTQGYSGNCWGYNFDWESRAFFQKKYTPTIVATTFVANAFVDAYEATNERSYLEQAISSKDFILKDLKRTYNDNGNFAFSYSPFDNTSVFNASLLGARLLSRLYLYTRDDELIRTAKKAVAYCCDYQNSNGSWFYSTLPFHQWIDNFHTGFNLECISEYGKYSGDKSFQGNFDNGLAYYLNTFFDKEGRSKYYNNSLYPIDIHAPSQMVITLAKSNCFESNRELIDKVMKWTIENMQSPKGYFFFQKTKYYTNKIPYMRWSQAWIFYALAYYIKITNKDIENLV
ncbi:prenyltransferase/squalene oxidase repeat-containing protein [Flavitalea sp.]